MSRSLNDTYPEPGRRVVLRDQDTVAQMIPEGAGQVGTITEVAGPDATPRVHVTWRDGQEGVYSRSYLLLAEDPEPVYQVLRDLKRRGVLSDWHQRQQGPDRGTWYLAGRYVPPRARKVSWAYVEGFAAGADSVVP